LGDASNLACPWSGYEGTPIYVPSSLAWLAAELEFREYKRVIELKYCDSEPLTRERWLTIPDDDADQLPVLADRAWTLAVAEYLPALRARGYAGFAVDGGGRVLGVHPTNDEARAAVAALTASTAAWRPNMLIVVEINESGPSSALDCLLLTSAAVGTTAGSDTTFSDGRPAFKVTIVGVAGSKDLRAVFDSGASGGVFLLPAPFQRTAGGTTTSRSVETAFGQMPRPYRDVSMTFFDATVPARPVTAFGIPQPSHPTVLPTNKLGFDVLLAGEAVVVRHGEAPAFCGGCACSTPESAASTGSAADVGLGSSAGFEGGAAGGAGAGAAAAGCAGAR